MMTAQEWANRPPFQVQTEAIRLGIDATGLKHEILARMFPDATDDAAVIEIPDLLTDMRLAKTFGKMYGDQVRFVSGIGWLFWNGQRWITDVPGGIIAYVCKMQIRLMEESRNIPNEKTRTEIRKGLIDLENHHRQARFVEALEHVPELIASTSELDRDTMLLNCNNATINLRNGVARPHSKSDLITKTTGIDYDADAQCPIFLKFLTWAMCGNVELVSYLQRYIGYCLTGATTEQQFSFWYGVGANGKSTLMNILKWLLGNYAATADSSLISKRDGSSDNNRNATLAGLRGARFVTLSELNDGERADEAAIKALTGEDPVTGRYLYQKEFTYRPQFKLVGFGNYKLHVKGTDHGFWRRMQLLLFGAVITDAEKDPGLGDKLRSELPGILAWAVQGCLQWQKSGLDAPKAIKEAVSDYREKEDMFRSWLSECCSRRDDYKTPAAALIGSFRDYSGWRNVSDKKFGDMLREAGFEKVRSNGIAWRGISLEFGTMEPSTPISQKSHERENRKFLENAPNRSTVPFSPDPDTPLKCSCGSTSFRIFKGNRACNGCQKPVKEVNA